MALQVIRERDAMRNGKPVFCPNFSMLMYDTPDEESIRTILKKKYGDGELQTEENGRYLYITQDEIYHVSRF
ncbi:MAG: hypothetical protein J6P40_09415 [Oscillospiraceae bacterium]|nr:hypothetical protein [Oscillospiraceae bacterium]